MERYEKLKILGRGVFGCAYLMRKREDGELVVIKQVLVETMSVEDREKARMECKVLGSLDHDCIVGLYDHFICEQGMLNIVMEYADGGTLQEVLADRKKREEPFTEDEVLDYVAMVADALEHVHQKRILHRDLKAANVFLDRNRVVKVGDFGLARVLSGDECAQTVVGTPYYLSPELVQGKPYDDRSDVWALGVLFYELACFRYPFNAPNLPALAYAIVNTEPEPFGPPKYSAEAWTLCAAMLRRDPAERPSVRAVLEDALLSQRLPRLRADAARYKAERRREAEANRSRPAAALLPDPDGVEAGEPIPAHIHPLKNVLPEDVLLAVLRCLGWRDLLRVGQVDRTLRRLALDASLWRPLCQRTFNLSEGPGAAPLAPPNDGRAWRALYIELAASQVWLWGNGCNNPRFRDELFQRGVSGVAFGREHQAAVTYMGEVLTWGDAGEAGQLGHGNRSPYKRPTLVKSLVSARAFVVQVAAGDLFTLALDASGAVWGWGTNEDGVLGFSPASEPQSEGEEEGESSGSESGSGSGSEGEKNRVLAPKRIAALASKRVVFIAAGSTHACAVTAEGEALTWGGTGEGRLGHARPPHVPEELMRDHLGPSCWEPKPAKLPADDPVASAACGAAFTVFLTRGGKVHTTGSNFRGEQGIGSAENVANERWEAGPVKAIEARVTQVAAGHAHALALCETGWVYSWGHDDCGQLGYGTTVAAKRPSLSGSQKKAPEGAAAGAEAPRGKLQAAWDEFATKKTVRKSDAEPPAGVPRVVKELLGKGVASVAAGSAHSLAVTEFGEVFTWGQNEYGQLGDDSRTLEKQWRVPRLVPALTENRRVRAAAGYNGSAALLGRNLPWQKDADGAFALRR